MSRRRPQAPDYLRGALEGVPWEIVVGSNHDKLMIAGRMVVVLTRGTRVCQRGNKNCLAAVRRAVREYWEQQR